MVHEKFCDVVVDCPLNTVQLSFFRSTPPNEKFALTLEVFMSLTPFASMSSTVKFMGVVVPSEGSFAVPLIR